MAAKKRKPDLKGYIIETALKLAAKRGWSNTSLRDIAKGAGVSLAELRGLFEDKTDILAGFERMIDRQVLAHSPSDAEGTPRERLFDLLMDRFEILEDYREGVVAILDSLFLDPKQAVIGMPYLCRSMSWMLEAAEMDTTGFKGAARVVGLTGVYLKVLHTWRRDDSPDLAKTMAALDKALSRTERAAEMLGF